MKHSTLFLLLAVLLASGCDKLSAREEADSLAEVTDSDGTGDTAVDTNVVPDTDEPDTDSPDTTPDTTDVVELPDEDMAPIVPIRTVSTEPLFGTMSVENRFRDPRFSLDANVWFAVNEQQTAYAPLRRTHLADSPGSQPTIVMLGSNDSRYVLGTANAAAGEHLMSIWLGRPEASVDASLREVEVLLLGWGPNGDATTQVGEAGGSVRIVDGIVWRRFEATVSGYWGSVEMLLGDTSGDDLYITGPSLIEIQPSTGGLTLAGQPPVEVRRFSARDRAAVDFAARMRQGQPTPQRRDALLREQRLEFEANGRRPVPR